ncbi:TonB-linked outer membrane protein, SusC/RagA family [Filimonas lacunae]|uniref:TonB-linked outer membrane protein, SusC/RagA family n=2 Tax=Filimonas lacunae TaxID=477680 RepID=A0A1N7QFC1_9BACT|nr:TonB-linked outer membrane protein, SusC/RagA family [Filimonas lacunae]
MLQGILIPALLLLGNSLFLQAYGQNKEMPFKMALDKIGALYGTSFIYEDNLFDKEPAVRFEVPANTQREIGEVLKELLYPRNYLFLFVDKTHYTIIKSKKSTTEKLEAPAGATPQTRLVYGKITDESGKPVEGATVVADGARVATVSAGDGAYRMYIPEGINTLGISYIGKLTQHVPVGASGEANVILFSESASLSEVVVVSTGLQQLPKERATGSFSVVSSKQLEQTPTPNILQRLETQVPGLMLTMLNGDNTMAYGGNLISPDPAAKAGIYTMKVRGTSTLNADQYPLVVIDGFPAEVDLRTLNPNDVEQVTVLKDAAAASIWGIRATNGVIVIQTKKGRLNQKTGISFNSNVGWAPKSVLNNQHLLTSAQMLDFEKELVDKNLVIDYSANDFAPGISQGMSLLQRAKRGEITQDQLNQQLAALGASTNYNEFGKYFMSAPNTQSYNLSVNGGGNAYSFFTSASYAREQTNLKGSATSRITLTSNQTFKIAKVIDFSSNVRLSFVNAAYNSIGLSALVNRSLPFMPYDHVVDADGNGIGYYQKFNQAFSDKLISRGYLDYRYNYLQEQQNMDNTIKETNLTGNFSVTAPVPLVKGLTANVLYSIEKSFSNSRNFQNEYTFAARDFMNQGTSYDAGTDVATMNVPKGGILSLQQNTRNNYSLRGQLTYSGKLGYDHELNMIAGSEIRQTYDVISPDLAYGWNDYAQRRVAVPTTYASMYGYDLNAPLASGYSDQQRRFLSYFSNAAYTFKGKYTVSGSVRFDDYNNFGLDVKYRSKPFWSSGASWNVLRESFMQQAKWVSGLTLRATYGISGNIDRTAHPEATIAFGSNDYVTNYPTAFIVSPANPELRWETTSTFNIGTDFAFLNQRITGSFEYYAKHGKDLFANFNTDPTLGFSQLNRNTATLDAKGFEGSLTGNIISKKNLSWSVTVTYAYNKNTITDNRYGIPVGIANSPIGAGYIKGYPTTYLFVYRFAGLDNKGQSVVYDQKNNKVTSAQSLTDINDLKYAGTTTPKYFGSINQNLRVGNFTLGAQLTYRLGYVFLKNSVPLYVSRSTVAYSLNGDIAKRWKQAGDEAFTNVPGLGGITYTSYLRYTYSDLNVLPGGYIRLQQVSLGYNLPDNLFKKLGMKNVNVQGVVRNLGLIWRKNKEGIDPDFQVGSTGTGLRLAPTPLYSFSINANF